MNGLLQTLRNLGPMRLTAIGGVGVLVLSLLIFATVQMSSGNLAPLYPNEIADSAESGQIVQRLEQMQVAVEVRNGGKQILVPADQVDRLRIALAAEGLPSGGSGPGNEIWDKPSSFGTTNFEQQVKQLRALEGELSRTIRAIKGVEEARVHLVLPRREMFSRTEQEPRASVFLRLRGSTALDREQVAAIQHLVSTAVPKLKPSEITIVDQRGQMLARGGDDAVTGLQQTAEERRLAYQSQLQQKLEDLLARSVGYGKVRAEVTVDMDFDRVEQTSQDVDPERQVVVSSQTVNEDSKSAENDAVDSVSVANQLPTAGADAAPGGVPTSSNSTTRTEERVNYEISRKTTTLVRQTGVVRRLSVAVLVDGNYAPAADGAEPAYQPRDRAELDQLAALARSAVGFDPNRGDTMEVVNLRFATPDDPGAEAEKALLFGLQREDLLRIAEMVTLGIVAVLVILLVIRPLIARAFDTTPREEEPDQGLLTDQSSGLPQLAAPSGALAQALAMEAGEEEEMEQMIDMNRVEGRVRASSLRKIGEIVDKHPEEAVAILRSWLYQET
ncbi:MAG TPA: flagellar basal-body MS-ring/collar protein FliF [Alphaproteobacteria bacterium]|nr:flagellar basal-body MS-ring/collar protein FliF [Alphaproteobacteria bacterium]